MYYLITYYLITYNLIDIQDFISKEYLRLKH